MSDRDHNPVWVNILLDDTGREDAHTDHSEPQKPARAGNREARLPEVADTELSARVLGRANTEEWKWRWQTMLRPLPEEASR